MLLLVIVGAIVFILVVVALIGAGRFVYDKSFGSSSSDYSILAKKFALTYSCPAGEIPEIAREWDYVEKQWRRGVRKDIWVLEKIPSFSERVQGTLGSHAIDIVNIKFTTSVANTWQGFLLGEGRGGMPSFYTTRMTIDSVTKYVSIQSPAGNSAYGVNFAPTSVVENILEKAKVEGAGALVGDLMGCHPYGRVLGLESSYLCCVDAF